MLHSLPILPHLIWVIVIIFVENWNLCISYKENSPNVFTIGPNILFVFIIIIIIIIIIITIIISLMQGIYTYIPAANYVYVYTCFVI